MLLSDASIKPNQPPSGGFFMTKTLTLKQARKQSLRMTQTEFAKELGVSRRTLCRYEKDGAPETILKLANHILKSKTRRSK